MAEPLTSSDIIRENLGFGPRTPDERQRAAAAGISPLGTMERLSFEQGRGISPTASLSEKEAWKMAEFQSGKREEAPVSYGGFGERPTGTSRRALRMQAEYDAARQVFQEMDLRQRAESRLQRQQDFEFENARIAEDRENRVLDEAGLMIDAIRGAVAPDGRVISNPIRPDDPDAIERLDNLARSFKFGVENKAAAGMFNQLYTDALKFREERMKDSRENERIASSLAIQTGRPFEEFGAYDEQGMFQPRMQGMIAGEQQVKAGEESKKEEQAIRTEERKAEAQAGVAERKGKESQQLEIQKNIRRATEDLRKLNASLAGRKSLSEAQRAGLTAAKDTLVDLQIERAALDGLAFESAEAYGAALREGRTIPSGTTIYIGRTPVKVK